MDFWWHNTCRKSAAVSILCRMLFSDSKILFQLKMLIKRQCHMYSQPRSKIDPNNHVVTVWWDLSIMWPWRSSLLCLLDAPVGVSLITMALTIALPNACPWRNSTKSGGHSKRKTRHLNKLLAYLWWSYMAFDKYCIYCVSVPSLQRESTDSLITATDLWKKPMEWCSKLCL